MVFFYRRFLPLDVFIYAFGAENDASSSNLPIPFIENKKSVKTTDFFIELNHELGNSLEERLRILGMCNEIDGRKEIEGEDTHDGLCVNNVSALHEVNVIIRKDYKVNELSDILNVAELNCNFFHYFYSLKHYLRDYYSKEKGACQPNFVAVISNFFSLAVFLIVALTF